MQPEPRPEPAIDPDVRERLTRLMLDRLALDPPSVTTDLFETGLLDSLGLVDLLAALEEEFDITIDFEDLEFENFATVDTIAGYVTGRRAIARASSPAPTPRVVSLGEARPRR